MAKFRFCFNDATVRIGRAMPVSRIDASESASRRTERSMRRMRTRRLLVEILETRRVMAATPIITEFLASNSGGLTDVDGETSDWIELYNPTESAVDLTNWKLTDDAGDLNQWTFPAVTIAPGEFMVVFASGKDLRDPSAPLHTNFRLSTSGDYLALVTADGTIANQFAPTYPTQSVNVSFGYDFQGQTLIDDGSAATVLVPSDATLGTTWQARTFDDSAWSAGSVGMGYGVDLPGFDVRYVKSRSAAGFNGEVTSLAVAQSVLGNPAWQSLSITQRFPTINFLGSGPGANYAGDVAFPNQAIGDDVNHFVIRATGTVTIPSSGAWSFGVNSDDGFLLTLRRGGVTYTSSFPGTRGPSDTISVFNLPQGGDYELELVSFEAFGGASVELFAASGAFTTFDPTRFDLVGDVASGGLAIRSRYVEGQNESVRTDVGDLMLGINSTAYVRIPLNVPDPAQVDALTLSVRYDDGFVAYLNGVEVARRGAPTDLQYDSAATQSRSITQVVTSETIPLSAAAVGALVSGENVLAIHALNDFAADDRFLIAPTLTARGRLTSTPSYFATPTPGAINADAVQGIVQRVVADLPAGFYRDPQVVSLTSPTIDSTIRYTTDGSTPSASHGTIYTGPITIDRTTNLRAIAYKADHVSLPSITRTYLYLDDVLTQSNNSAPPPGWPSTWNTNLVDYGIDPDVIALEGATRIKQALLAIPTVSITTELANLFDPTIGIYSNAEQDGRDWERAASAEWINPDGSEGFQVNAGLRIRGGYSRIDANPKHAFKLFFRGLYGDSTLNYPVHGDEGVTEFDKLDLRTAQNYSWSFDGDPSNNFVAEVLARQNQRDLGQAYTRSTWIHLYLNGQYWGLYQTQERADANYAAAYFGGNAIDYDVIKPERGDYRNIATDGNFDAYTQLWQQAAARDADGRTPAFVNNAAYLRAQGKNPDGSNNPNYPVLLDVDNLIVYMLETIRGGNLDAPISNFLGNDRPNNYFAIRSRVGREGFRFIQHDAEHTMRNVNENRNGPYNSPDYETSVDYFNPQWLHQQLMANAEYRLRFADFVQFAFFNDGPISTNQLIDKLDAEAAEIDLAVIAESARWGDAKRGVNQSPLGRANFLAAIQSLRSNYLPARNPIVIDQLRNTDLVLKNNNGAYNVVVDAPLYPAIDAPQYRVDGVSQHGGAVAVGSRLRIDATGGIVHYTTDGSDPRLFGGDLNPNSLAYDPRGQVSTLVAAGSNWRYRAAAVTPPTNWNGIGFDDTNWSAGDAELGYGDGDEATTIPFGPDANNKYIATYFRRSFVVNQSTADIGGLTLRVRRDDGIVVYLNGREIARDNLPAGVLMSTTPALTAIGGADESAWLQFTIDPALLVSGENVLAAAVHQVSGSSSDLTFAAELIATRPISPAIPINVPLQIAARTLAADGTWSAITRAEFTVPLTAASAANLRITEIHYNPIGSGDETEFVELQNISDEAVSLQDVRFTDGIDFQFNDGNRRFLAAGEIVLVVKNVSAFTSLYGSGLPVAGEFPATSLNNAGERITVLAADGAIIQSFDYDDVGVGWHPGTDGSGPSLTVLRTAGDYSSGSNWRPSFVDGGTPGVIETGATVVNRGIAYAGATASYGPNAVSTAITPLLPGQTATSANVSNYTLGLNRIALDVAKLGTQTLIADDFEFRVGNSQDVASWSVAPAPLSIAVTAGGGMVDSSGAASDRVTLTWANGAIRNQWLQVRLKPSGAVPLAAADLFFFGHQTAEINAAAPGQFARVNSFDVLSVRANQSAVPNSAGINNRYDLNRSGSVNALDELIARSNQQPVGGLLMITAAAPAASTSSSPVVGSPVVGSPVVSSPVVSSPVVGSVATSTATSGASRSASSTLAAAAVDAVMAAPSVAVIGMTRGPGGSSPLLSDLDFVRQVRRSYFELMSDFSRSLRDVGVAPGVVGAQTLWTAVKAEVNGLMLRQGDRTQIAIDEFFAGLRFDLQQSI